MTSGHHLFSVVSRVALRIIDVVAEFSLNGKWRGNVIHKWEEAFQMLVGMDHKPPVQMSEQFYDFCHLVGNLGRVDDDKRERSPSSVLGLLDITGDKMLRRKKPNESTNKIVLVEKDVSMTPGPHLQSAAWILSLRILNIVAEFTTNRDWGHDLIEKWKEAYQVLEAIDRELSCQALEYHTGFSEYSQNFLSNQTKKPTDSSERHHEAVNVLESAEIGSVRLVQCVTSVICTYDELQ